jgi:hypothetical protein
VIPLYGFLEGDVIGLLVLADERETVESLARKLERSAAVRVAPRARLRVRAAGRALDGSLTVAAAGLTALDRFDVAGADGEER